MAVRCKVCDAELEDREHLERHLEIHKHHKAHPTAYGDPYFPQPIWSANVDGFAPLFHYFFGKGEEPKPKRKK